MKRRMLALLLVIVMLIGMVPTSVFADAASPEDPASVTEVEESAAETEAPEEETEAPTEEETEAPTEEPTEPSEDEEETEAPAEETEAPTEEVVEEIEDLQADAGTANVYFTVSVEGVLGKTDDGKAAVELPVTVKDTDNDGILTFHDALVALHDEYRVDGYTLQRGVTVTKLWGITTYATNFYKNGKELEKMVAYKTSTVEDDDQLYAVVMTDATDREDCFTWFDKTEVTVKVGESFKLTLTGECEDYTKSGATNIPVGIWNDGAFTQIGSTRTDTDGNVTLSFDEAGTYIVTAKGVLPGSHYDDEWEYWDDVDCPTIAPYCIVTVEGGAPAVTTATVTLRVQEYGDQVVTAFNEEISSDLAESYGYTDQVTDGVSALDVLVRAHELTFIDGEFNPDNAEDYLVVGTNGSISRFMQEDTSALCIMVNGAQPGNGSLYVNQAKVEDGDFVFFAQYEDLETWSDRYVWLETTDGKRLDGQTIYAGENANLELVVMGISAAMGGTPTPVAGAKLARVDMSTGATNPWKNAVSDANGKVTLVIPEGMSGSNQCFTAIGEEMMSELSTVKVGDVAVPSDLFNIKVAVGGKTQDTIQELTLSPEYFHSTKTYTVAPVGYIENENERYLWIYVDPLDSCTGGYEYLDVKKDLPANKNRTWVRLGKLTPGEDNVVVLFSTPSGVGYTQTYTVTIPMKGEPESAEVYFTVSNQGVLAKTPAGEAAIELPVTVKDLNSDGVLTYNEALVALHEKYCPDGYEIEIGKGFVKKFWGVTTEPVGSYYFLKNNVPLSMGVADTSSTVEQDDHLYAAVMKDEAHYSDVISYFDSRALTVDAYEDFTLNLQGSSSVIEGGFKADNIADIQIGIWVDGTFTPIQDAVTDAKGNVTLNFEKAGTYVISASGSVTMDVQDWSNGGEIITVDAPLTAPYCIVTVNPAQIVTATVSYSGQGSGAFFAAGVDVEIPSNLAERYGFKDNVDSKTAVSALDVLVQAHLDCFGEDFTKANATDYLVVAPSGWVSKLFGVSTSWVAILVNGTTPGNATVNQAKVVDGDEVMVGIYQTTGRDNYIWLVDEDGNALSGQTLETGRTYTVTVMGHGVFSSAKSPVANAEIYLVDTENGTLETSLGTTGSDGKCQITIPGSWENSTRCLTANGTNTFMSLSKVNVVPGPAVTDTVTIMGWQYDYFSLTPKVNVEVSSDLAESYGLKDTVYAADGVSALDALVKASELMFGEAFTAETVGKYLTVQGSSVKNALGNEDPDSFVALVNGSPAGIDGTLLHTGDKVLLGYRMDDAENTQVMTVTTADGELLDGQSIDVRRLVELHLMGTPLTGSEASAYANGFVNRIDLASGKEDRVADADADGVMHVTIPKDFANTTLYLLAYGDDTTLPTLIEVNCTNNPLWFNKQPASASYSPFDSREALAVEVGTADEDALPYVTYQWYANTTESYEGATLIEGAAAAEYIPEDVAVGETRYYFCTATHPESPELTGSLVFRSEIVSVAVKSYADAAQDAFEGTGTAADPFRIAAAEDYQTVYDLVAAGYSFSGMYLAQTADVTLPEGWQPIGVLIDPSVGNIGSRGSNMAPFSGHLDGCGNTLTVPEGGLPLLGYVKDAYVEDLNIYGPQIEGYGLVNNLEGVGLSGNAITIEGVTLKSGTRTLKSGLIGTYLTNNPYAGCSGGYLVTIRDCVAEAGVVIGYTGEESMIGTFAGRFIGTIENCVSHATVYGKDYVGGIVGSLDNSYSTFKFLNCTFDGTVEASGELAGGILGGGYSDASGYNAQRATIKNCSVSGSITGADKVGGIEGGNIMVVQTFANGPLYIQNNTVSASVTAANGKAVGAVIGFLKGLNRNDYISGNIAYTKTLRPVGQVEYVDTNAQVHEDEVGINYINTENGTAGLPALSIPWFRWNGGLNRTDDLLGTEAATMCTMNEGKMDPKADSELVGGKSTKLSALDSDTGKAIPAASISWALANPDDAAYATVTAAGAVKTYAVASKHDVTFVGTLKNGYTGAVKHTITIYPAATQVEILRDGENVTGKTLYLNGTEGAELALTGKLYPADAMEGLTWKSSNTKILKVADGVVTYVKGTGTVTITATAADGSKKAASVKIQVGSLTQSVTIAEPASTVLRSGKSLTLKAVTEPVKPTVSGVTFQLVDSTDSAYATVTAAGKVTAKAVNEPHAVQIKAVSKDAAKVESNVITLTILPKSDQSLILKSGDSYVTKTTLVRNVNETVSLAAYTLDVSGETPAEEKAEVTWKSSNAKVASVAEDGTVTCLKSGSATITATSGKIKATVTIKVSNLVEKVTIATAKGTDFTVASGKTLALKATVEPANASSKAVTWAITNGSAYAKISSSGTVTANKDLTAPVTVTVTATAKDGSGTKASQQITITPLAQGLEIKRPNASENTTLVWDMADKDTLQLNAIVYPAAAQQSVTWKSSNAKVASIDANGKITCLKAGTVTITATAKDGSGKKASFKLTVVKLMKDLQVADGFIAGGKSLTLKSVITPADTTNKKLSWSLSENAAGAGIKISSSGKLTTKAVKERVTVTVTVTAPDGSGVTADCKVTVCPATTKVTISVPGGGSVPTTMAYNELLVLKATSTPDGADGAATVYTWKTNNKLVTVKDGNVTADPKALGKTVTITATAADGTNKSASVKVKIVAPEVPQA